MICQYCGTRYRGKECPNCGTPSGKKQPPACEEPLYGNYKWEQSVARSKAYTKQIKKDTTPPPEWAKREEPSTPIPAKKKKETAPGQKAGCAGCLVAVILAIAALVAVGMAFSGILGQNDPLAIMAGSGCMKGGFLW